MILIVIWSISPKNIWYKAVSSKSAPAQLPEKVKFSNTVIEEEFDIVVVGAKLVQNLQPLEYNFGTINTLNSYSVAWYYYLH